MDSVDLGVDYGSAILENGSVALVTCIDESGRPNIITCSAIYPIIIGYVSVAVGFTRYSHDLIKRTREFVVNLPDASLSAAVDLCGSKSGREYDKFIECGLTPGEARAVQVPIIEECMAWIECKVFSEAVSHDHTFFIGRVAAAYARRDSCDRMFQPDQCLNKWALLSSYADEKMIRQRCGRSGADSSYMLKFWRNYYRLFDPSVAERLDRSL